MWRGYELALTQYYNMFWSYSRDYHKIKTVKLDLKDVCGKVVYPPWLGCPAFHATHRARLLAKDYDFYCVHSWVESPAEGYDFWPVEMDGSLHPIVKEWINDNNADRWK